MPDNDLLTRLSARRPGLEQLEPTWRLIDDVVAGRIKRRGPASSGNGWLSPYLPKGRLEPDSEYALRVELTPFFPQTPQILASRLGALFKQPLQIDFGLRNAECGLAKGAARDGQSEIPNPKSAIRMEQFMKDAGRRHASFEDIAVQAACLAQMHGFCAALLDRDPLPDDVVRGRDARATAGETPAAQAGRMPAVQVSTAEAAARNLGRPYLALYGAPSILDWDFGSDGRLTWVKFGEQELWRPRWDADPEPVQVYRIVDREAIHVYRVRRASGGELQVLAAEPIRHGLADTVPVVFLHPFPAQDGIGRPVLQRAAEADIAATRILSDLVWDLFLLGNPILTLKTSRSEEDLRRLGLGATRYIPLDNGRPGTTNPETLEFVQLDPGGIQLLFRAHALFAAQATRQDSGAEAAVPQEQSGVAQAWRFKTGEERVLFMLARALAPFLSRCLELADWGLRIADCGLASAAPADEGTRGIVVRLPESFDVTAPSESLDTAQKVLEVAERLGQTELARAALRRIEAVLGVQPAETRAALAAERDELELTAETQKGRV
ncbi:MAG: hypothetical protein NTW87_04295 [Planctomycetota bacterium]|nr:hypothetical protein [Planctomycetota bacterium]